MLWTLNLEEKRKKTVVIKFIFASLIYSCNHVFGSFHLLLYQFFWLLILSSPFNLFFSFFLPPFLKTPFWPYHNITSHSVNECNHSCRKYEKIYNKRGKRFQRKKAVDSWFLKWSGSYHLSPVHNLYVLDLQATISCPFRRQERKTWWFYIIHDSLLDWSSCLPICHFYLLLKISLSTI